MDYQEWIPTKTNTLIFSAASSVFYMGNYGPEEYRPYVLPAATGTLICAYFLAYCKAMYDCLHEEQQEEPRNSLSSYGSFDIAI